MLRLIHIHTRFRRQIANGSEVIERKAQERLMHPNISYLIMATPRSGSFLLCEALINTNLAGRPTEYFGPAQTRLLLKEWCAPGYAACLARIMEDGTTPNGVFGAKIIWQFLEDFVDHLRDIHGYEKLSIPHLLSAIFPHLSYIWITRRDKVRQAISYWKALQTDDWIGIEDGQTQVPSTASKSALAENGKRQPSKNEVLFDFKTIERLRRGIEEDEREMQQYFAACQVQPLKIVYEDFVGTYEETALQVLDYLRIPVSGPLVFGERTLKKQANEQTEEWVQRYYEMKQKEKREL
jgi:trehalose 2-sulfotransferase